MITLVVTMMLRMRPIGFSECMKRALLRRIVNKKKKKIKVLRKRTMRLRRNQPRLLYLL